MARIPNIDFADLNAEQRKVHEAIASGPRGAVRGPLSVWLYRPALADKAQQLGRYCRYDSSLPARLSELAILVTARIWDAAFEWQAHEPAARDAGLSEDIIEALSCDEPPHFTQADEAVVYRVTQEVNLQRCLSSELYDEAEKLLGRDGLIDLIGVLGYYSLISMTIKVFDVSADGRMGSDQPKASK